MCGSRRSGLLDSPWRCHYPDKGEAFFFLFSRERNDKLCAVIKVHRHRRSFISGTVLIKRPKPVPPVLQLNEFDAWVHDVARIWREPEGRFNVDYL